MSEERLSIIIGIRDEATTALSKIRGEIVGIGAAYLGWQGAKAIISWTIEAAMESEKVWAGVANSLDNIGESSKRQLPVLQEFAAQFLSTAGIADEEIGLAVERLMSYGMGSKQAMDVMGTAVDFAAKRHIDLRTTVDLVGKAFAGNTQMLSRYGIIIDDTLSKTDKFRAALDKMAQSSVGAAAKEMETLSGQVKRMKEELAELGEQLGGKQEGLWTKTAGSIANYIHVIRQAADWIEVLELLNPLLANSMQDVILAREKQINLETSGGIGSLQAVAWNIDKLTGGYFSEKSAIEELTPEMQKHLDDLDAFAQKSQTAAREQANLAANIRAVAAGQQLVQNQVDKYIKPLADLTQSVNQTKELMLVAQTNYDEYMGKLNAAIANIKSKGVEMDKETIKRFEALKKGLRNAHIESLQITQEFENALSGGVGHAMSLIVDTFWQGRVTLQDCWSAIAGDFLHYMVDVAAKQIVSGLVKLFLMIFDNPVNDRGAMQQGLDYGRYFMEGVRTQISASQFALAGPTVMQSSANSISAPAHIIIINGGSGDADSAVKAIKKAIDTNALPILTRKTLKDGLNRLMMETGGTSATSY